MECYVSLALTPKRSHHAQLASFFTALNGGDTQAAGEALGQLDADALEGFEALLLDRHIGEYLSSFETVTVKPTTLSAGIVTGSLGLEFAVALIELLAPYCDEISGTYEHDEEPPEDEEWPFKLTYEDGAVYANGLLASELTGSLEEDHTDYQWLTGPVLDEATLAAVHDICRKATEQSHLSELITLYKALCLPIAVLVQQHAEDLQDGPLGEDWVADLESLLTLDATQKDHPVIHFLTRKMRANLAAMAGCNYFGSIATEYAKTLYTCVALIQGSEDGEEEFEEMFGDVEDDESFDAVYELVALSVLLEE